VWHFILCNLFFLYCSTYILFSDFGVIKALSLILAENGNIKLDNLVSNQISPNKIFNDIIKTSFMIFRDQKSIVNENNSVVDISKD
jgi:hypothetical protein